MLHDFCLLATMVAPARCLAGANAMSHADRGKSPSHVLQNRVSRRYAQVRLNTTSAPFVYQTFVDDSPILRLDDCSINNLFGDQTASV